MDRDDLSARPSTKSKMPRGAAGAQKYRRGASSPEASIAKVACALITLPPCTR
jgi:hypothetical protein